ncbi:MAG: HDIG domain-containing protein [Thermodesulfobacteriota bacterium]|nr:HDIG domain-containing protein [Thermodesulfobacteriota bacterium]
MTVLNGEKKKKVELPSSSQKTSAFEGFKDPSFQRWLMVIVLAIFVTIFISPHMKLPSTGYRVGDVASKDIKSPQDLLVEDEQSTEQRITEAEASVMAVYDFDPDAYREIEKRVISSFTMMRAFYKNIEDKIRENDEITVKKEDRSRQKMAVKIDLTPFKDQIEMKRDEFEKTLGIDIEKTEFSTLEKNRFGRNIERYIRMLTSTPLERGIVGNKDLLYSEKDKGVIFRNIKTKKESEIRDILSIWDLKDAQKAIMVNSNKILDDVERHLRNTVITISQGLIKPNLTFNKNETEQRKKEIKENVKPVFYQVKRGEIIVREGEVIKGEHLVKLKAFEEVRKYDKLALTSLGLILFIVLLGYAVYNFTLKDLLLVPVKNKDLFFLSITLGTVVLLAKTTLLICEAISNSFTFIPFDSCLYAIPIASGAMLISIILNTRVALIFSIIISIFTGILLENRLEFFIYPLIGSIVATHGVVQVRLRTTLIKTGSIVGLVNMVTIISFNMIEGHLFALATLIDIAFGFLGGLLVGFIVIGITPLVEAIFGYTTDIKLLELANLDNPILRDLIVQAPGTYHHSIIVGTLVEAAAKSINANPLLSRVSAYYHDIGKIKKPLYFIENQRGTENRHEKLAPSMSSLILLSHIKDGVEMAKANGLGQQIIDIIRQHHGTSLITFFYQKAKNKENPELYPVDEKDYRYPGPKPQTKEAGLVLLADAVEAASKTLPDPSPSRIQGMVQRIINNMFADGQLNECELTLKDLNEIAKSFNKILTGIFHHRIEYPEPAYKESAGKKKVNDTDKRQARDEKDKRAEDKKNGEDDLKRLGMS